MKQNDNIAAEIRRNPLSQSISSLNKRGVSIDSFRNNKRAIDSLRSSSILSEKKIIYFENEAHKHSINTAGRPNEQSPIHSLKRKYELTQSCNRFSYSCVKMFLPPQSRKDLSKKTLVLDLDETLVHSDFKKYKDKADIAINVTVDNKTSEVYVLIRPGTDVFLEKMAQLYELVIFTASISKVYSPYIIYLQYAEPLIIKLDQKKLVAHTLFREHCTIINNTAVKDLKRLNRDLKKVILIDNSPSCYSLNPENGFPIKSWFDDQNDRELFKLLPILEFLSEVPDVRDYIGSMQDQNAFSYVKAANIMNSYYSNQKRSNELSKSFQYKSRPNEDNASFFNSFNSGKSFCNGNGRVNSNGNANNGNIKYAEEQHQKNVKQINSTNNLSIDPLVKENINYNENNNYNMFKRVIDLEHSSNSNHYRKIKNARHQYNLSDSKVIYQEKTNTEIVDSQLNNHIQSNYAYHTKHVSIVLDKDSSPTRNKNGDSQVYRSGNYSNDSNSKKNSSAVLIKQKQFINTNRDLNPLHLQNHKQKEKEDTNLTDISKEQYNNFLISSQRKYISPINKSNNSNSPISLRQSSTYSSRPDDNEKRNRICLETNNVKQGLY